MSNKSKYLPIGSESLQNARNPIDIDHMRNRYKTANRMFIFPGPSLETIEQHLFFLLRNSNEKKFEQKYIMKPDYLSYDEYGTISLKELLMYINGIFTIEDFILDKVVIPSFSSIVYICQDKFQLDRDESDLIEIEW